jgi:hypothetical protein
VLRDPGAPDRPEQRPYRTLWGSMYAAMTTAWLDAFGADATVVFFEQLAADPDRVVAGLCRWLEVDSQVVHGFDFSTQNETRPARSFLIHRVAVHVNAEQLLGGRRRLKAPLRRLYYAVNGRRSGERMAPATRRHLEQILAPGNQALAHELAARGYADMPDWVSAAGSPNGHSSSP